MRGVSGGRGLSLLAIPCTFAHCAASVRRTKSWIDGCSVRVSRATECGDDNLINRGKQMATQTIVGRDGQTQTIISDSYAFHGEIQGPPAPPEPTRNKPRSLTRAQVKAKFGWNDADFEEALQLNFPVGGHVVKTGSDRKPWCVREDLLDRWAGEQRAAATTIRRLVG